VQGYREWPPVEGGAHAKDLRDHDGALGPGGWCDGRGGRRPDADRGAAEFFAVMSNSNGNLRAIVDDVSAPTPPAECGKADGARAKFKDGRYVIVFPRSCIGNPPTISVQGFMFFDKQPYAPGHGAEDLSDITVFTPDILPI
jgi:hypothetical protein